MARGPRSLAPWRRDAIRRINASRRAALAFAKRVPEPELRRARTLDQWSLKDTLAHLVTCDEETTRRFRLIARGRADRIFWFMSMADADRFNAKWVTKLRPLGVPALLRRMERARADLVTALQRLPLGSLNNPSHKYPVVGWLAVPGWSHVYHHLDEMKAWWRRQPKGRASAAASKRRAAPRNSGHASF